MMTAAILIGLVVLMIPLWRIFQRLGYSPYLAFAMLLPFINIGLLYYIAFLDWPIEKGRAAESRKWS